MNEEHLISREDLQKKLTLSQLREPLNTELCQNSTKPDLQNNQLLASCTVGASRIVGWSLF